MHLRPVIFAALLCLSCRVVPPKDATRAPDTDGPPDTSSDRDSAAHTGESGLETGPDTSRGETAMDTTRPDTAPIETGRPDTGGADSAPDTGPTDPDGDSCGVSSHSPASWALAVARDESVVVTFDGDVDGGTVTDDSLLVIGEVSGYLPGLVTWDATTNSALFVPDGRAQPGERVTAVLTSAVVCGGSGAPGARVWTWTAAVDAGTGVLTDGGSTETGDYSYFVLARDLNGDGALDLVTADAIGATFSVLLAPSYAVTQSVSAPYYPRYLDGADVDRDVLATDETDEVLVLFNDGTGTLADPVGYPSANQLISLRDGDLDGDGDLDLVAMSLWGYVTVLTNDGAGVFAETQRVSVSFTWEPYMLDLGDLDGDDDLDIVALHYSGFYSVLLNDGAGAFTEDSSAPISDSHRSVVVNDFDGDGTADMAMISLYDNYLKLFSGDGTGALAEASTTSAWGPHELCAGDLDSDGDIDLVTPRLQSAAVSPLINDGAGTFSQATDLVTEGEPTAVACADMNGDGALDVAVSQVVDGWTSAAAVLLNTP